MKQQHKLLEYWPLFFLLSFLEAAVAFIALLRIPSEGAGVSLARLALLFPLLIVMIIGLVMAYRSWRYQGFREKWLAVNTHPGLYRFLSIALPIFAVIGTIFSFLFRWWEPDQLLPFFERIWPLLAFTIIFCIQSTIWILVLRFGIHKANFLALKPAILSFVLLLIIFFFISLTKLGVKPDPAYWGEPGVALQGWQLGFALIAGASFLPIGMLPFFKSRRADLILSVLIWILAAGLWVCVPNEVLKNSFYFPIDPPANMPLPYSDSGYYDSMAHSLLIGTDYMGQIPTRPLYILFLTTLHLFFGENYFLIITGQTIVFAVIPVLFYLLGTKLHSRAAGLTIALLATFRELTSMMVASDTRVSNAKILLVDTPTLLLILLTCLLAIRWLENKDKRYAFITGAVFGVLLLLRTQSMLILPFLFLVAFLVMRRQKNLWFVPLVFFILGVFISITPWLTHNYLRIGKFAFDAPFQYQVLASQYAYTGNLDFQAVDLENKSLSQILITFILKDPGFVAEFMSNHFLATEVGAMLALPLIYPFYGLQEPINIYWTSFNGTLTWNNILLTISYLVIIAIGLGTSWKRWRWIGLLPLAFNLGYATANGVGRFSGWRYDLPADWIAYFYFGIGFVEILLWVARIFGYKLSEEIKTVSSNYEPNLISRLIPAVVLFTLIGFLPWIAESVNPAPKYAEISSYELQLQMAELQDQVSLDDIHRFAKYPEVVTLTGRLLYPRSFGSKAGLSSATPWPSYEVRDYPRLGFKLQNHDLREVVFPNKGVAIENVHGKDVILIGCQRDDYIEARLMVFPNEKLSYLSNLSLESCSQ